MNKLLVSLVMAAAAAPWAITDKIHKPLEAAWIDALAGLMLTTLALAGKRRS
jgi:hypothetical protein